MVKGCGRLVDTMHRNFTLSLFCLQYSAGFSARKAPEDIGGPAGGA